MTDRKELELLIRTTLKGRGEIESIAKTIKDLEGAIERQAEAAKKGENAYDGLKAALDSLRVAQDQLAARRGAIDNFERQSAAIAKTSAAIDKARGKYDAYAAKLKEIESTGKALTDEQVQQQTKLQASLDRQLDKLARQQKGYALLGEALREIGVDTSNLAAAQAQLVQAQLDGGTAIDRAQKELAAYADTVGKARAETKALADQQRQAKQDADLFAAAEKKAADATAARAKAFSDFQDRQANRRGQVVSDARQSDEDRKALDRQRELAALRADIEGRSAIAVRDTGLIKTADDAEAAARQYNTLARASKNLRPQILSLRDAVDAINDPSKAVAGNLGAMEKAVAALTTKVAGINGPVDDYAATLRELASIQKGLSAQGALVDRFNKDRDALRASVAEMNKARDEVAQYAAAMRKGGTEADAFAQKLAASQARLKQVSAEVGRQGVALRESRDALRSAGINTSQLVSEQQRLVGVAQQAATAVKSLADAQKKNGDETEKAAKKTGLFRDEGRTTLSLMQRIRGELLAMAAAYVGVQGAINLAKTSLDAFTQKQALESRLSLAVGNNPTRIGEEVQYLRKEADRLGIAFDDASKGYSKFAVSAVKSGQSIRNTRFIFEGIAEASRVLNLSGPETEGIFNAISQSFSKGKIQAEELRGQIGERLPGAFAFAQEALKNVFPDLDKALEKGLVGSENLVLIVESLRKATAERLPTAIRSLDAEQQRFNNSVNDFKLLVANSGFADEYIKLLKDLTAYLKSADGEKFAQSISQSFATVAEGIRFLVQNFEGLKTILTTVAIYIAGGWATAAVGGLVKVTAAATGLSVAIARIGMLIPVVGALLAGWAIGDYLKEKFLAVELAGIYMVQGILTGFSLLKSTALEVFYELPRYALNAFKGMINFFNNVFATPFVKVLRDIARAAGFEDVAKGLDKVIGTLSLRIDTEVSSNTAALREQAKKDLDQIKSITEEMATDARVRVAVRGVSSAADASDNRFKKGIRGDASNGFDAPTGKPKAPTEGEINRRKSEIEQITKALETLDAKIDRTQTDTLSKQLEAIDTEYQALARRITKLGGDESRKFLEQLNTAVGQLKLQTTKKFNDKLEADNEALLSKIEAAEAASGRKQKTDIDARLAAIKKTYEATYRDIEEQRQKLIDNGRGTGPADEAKRRLDSAVKELQAAERIKALTDELELRQRQITDTVKARADYIQAIRDQEEAGLITRADAEQKIKAQIAQTQPLLDDLINAGFIFAESISGALDPTRIEAFRAVLAKAQTGGAAAKPKGPLDQFLDKFAMQAADQGLDALIDKTKELIKGTISWSQAFKDAGDIILNMIAQILLEIGKQIIKEQILLAIQVVRMSFGGGGGGNGLPSGLIPSGAVMHSGGVVGQVANRTRSIDASWFANAPRYHTGGISGLAPDEYPAILKKNEEVLQTGDPRNVMNMARNAPAQSGPTGLRFVLVDDRAKVPEAMAGADGERVTMMHIQRNIASLRQQLK